VEEAITAHDAARRVEEVGVADLPFGVEGLLDRERPVMSPRHHGASVATLKPKFDAGFPAGPSIHRCA